MDEQPKDFVEAQEFDEWMKGEISNLPFFKRFYFFLQDYLLWVLSIVSVIGYIAGVYLGRFW